MQLRQHDVVLRGERVVLRPMNERDWGPLLRWCNDPDVLYYAEGDEVTSRSLGEVHNIYRSVSENAYCFMIEHGGQPIGDCWLQQMNLDRILEKFPGRDVRRIDIAIGEKRLWGQGIGTEAIGLLVSFGFQQEKVDAIFGCDIADYNPRSLRAFQKVGFEIYAKVAEPEGAKARYRYDVILTRERYDASVRCPTVAP